jgi:steroid 5-alpha reductase family enzyme
MVVVWAVRLGSFLFRRVRKDGGDGRFDQIKLNPLRFFMTWTIQGLWVLFTAAAALAVITSEERVELGVVAFVGIAVWVLGFAVEVVADRQKSAFRADPANRGKFIATGLWAWSRHPNYFGEITLWLGIAIVALPLLEGWRWVMLISPVFVWALITRVSGVPMLERRADEKWGGDEDYEAYKASTPVLMLKPPTKG